MRTLIPTVKWKNNETNVVGKMIDTTILTLESKNAIFGDRKWLFFALNILSSITYACFEGFCGASCEAHLRQEIKIFQHVLNYHIQLQKLFLAVILLA